VKFSYYRRKALTLAALIAIAILAVSFLALIPADHPSDKRSDSSAAESRSDHSIPGQAATGSGISHAESPVPSQRDARANTAQPDSRLAGAALAGEPSAGLSPEGKALLQEQMRRDFRGLEAVYHADGRISLDLQGRFMHVTAVVDAPSGQTQVQCFSDAEALFERLESKR